MTRRVYLYAFDYLMNVVDVKFLQDDAITVRNMKRTATWMKETNLISLVVYAIDNRPGLHDEFTEARKSNDFTKHIEFADTVRREGTLMG